MIIRIIYGVLFIALTAVGVIYLFGWVTIERALPTYEGTLELSSLERPITIYRDTFAVAHIDAQTENDAYIGLGFVHAQERLFQMETMRRFGRGRLSEIFGERTFIADVWSRTIDFAAIARNMFEAASNETKNRLNAYCRGVNAYIISHRSSLGFEFDALGCSPDLWKPEDCMIIARLISWQLNFSAYTDAAFISIATKVSAEQMFSLLPYYSGASVLEEDITPPALPVSPVNPETRADSANIITDSTSLSLMHNVRSSLHSLTECMQTLPSGGSNVMCIGPKRTKSGGAVLANDLHLNITAPAQFYVAHCKSRDGLNVAGATVPGLPVFLIGRNQHISWGISNGMIDESDYFLLEGDDTLYHTPFGTKAYEREETQIKILQHSGDTVRKNIIIRRSAYGPIVSELSPYEYLSSTFGYAIPHYTPQTKHIALLWNGSLVNGDEIGAYIELHKAEKINSDGLLSEYATPCVNLCLADAKGNIGYRLIGRIPRRTGGQSLLMLRSANNISDQWSSYDQSSSLPMSFSTYNSYFISANNPATRYSAEHYSMNWEPSSRAEIIRKSLVHTDSIDRSKSSHILTSETSEFHYRTLLPILIHAIDELPNKSRLEEEAAEYLNNWDGVESTTDVAATIINAFLPRLITAIAGDELENSLLMQYSFVGNVPIRMIDNLLKRDHDILWDDIRTPQRESRDIILRGTFRRTITDLERLLGSDSRKWYWGRVHHQAYRHIFSQGDARMRRLADIDIGGVGGSMTTPMQKTYSFLQPYEVIVAPVVRMYCDMASQELSIILPTGNSGNIYSPHYADMTKLFESKQYITFSLNMNNASWKRLLLMPLK